MEKVIIKKIKICVCMCGCVSTSMSLSSVLCPGPLECCCGRYFLLDICHTPAKATRKFWSSSPVEDGWIHLRTALGLCRTLLGTFLLVTKLSFSFQKISGATCASLRQKSKWLLQDRNVSETSMRWVSLPALQKQ